MSPISTINALNIFAEAVAPRGSPEGSTDGTFVIILARLSRSVLPADFLQKLYASPDFVQDQPAKSFQTGFLQNALPNMFCLPALDLSKSAVYGDGCFSIVPDHDL